MAKKRRQQQVAASQSFGSMVSKAALEQLGPQIAQMVRDNGEQIYARQLATLQILATRLTVTERIIKEKLNISEDELQNRILNLEDEQMNMTKVDTVRLGDFVRVTVQTKLNDQSEFQGVSNHKISNVGTGRMFGVELEQPLIGMLTGETKEIKFGNNQELTAKITIDRVSRLIQEESTKDKTDENPTQG